MIADLAIALVIATVLVAVLGAGIRRVPFGPVLLAMFAVLFLATWAGGAWLAPVGARPLVASVSSFAIVGLMIALLMTALMPRYPPRTRGEALRQRDARREVASFVNIFFWLLLVILLVVIAARYL